MPPTASDPGRFDRAVGWLLFLPVPIVLVLFTRFPLGPYPSLGLGLLLMLTHPLYARLWAIRRARRRCLWCGGSVRAPKRGPSAGADPARSGVTALTVSDPRGSVEWGCCGDRHRAAARRALALAWRLRGWLRGGILGSLVLSLLGIVLGAAHRLGPITPADASAFFRLMVALAVLPLGWFGMPLSGVGGTKERSSAAAGRTGVGTAVDGNDSLPGGVAPVRAPFPLHLAALPGIAAVLWLFRLIGLLWLAQGVRHFLPRPR